MGVDLQKLREKLEKMRDPNKGFGNTDLWSPNKEGELEKVRFIHNPFADEGEDPFVELWFHYRIGKGRGILCPRKNWGKTCPVCEWAKSIVDNSDEDKELAKELWPKQRFYGVVVDRKEETPTPKWYGFGQTVYFELCDKLLDAEYEEYLDPKVGIDITVKCKKDGDAKFPKTSLTWSRKGSKLANTAKVVEEILSAIKPLDDIFKPMTTSEIADRLNEWLDYKSENAEDHSGEETRGKVDNDDLPFDKGAEESTEKIDADFEAAIEAGRAEV